MKYFFALLLILSSQLYSQIKVENTGRIEVIFAVDNIDFEDLDVYGYLEYRPVICTIDLKEGDKVMRKQIIDKKSKTKAELMRLSDNRFLFTKYDSANEVVKQGHVIISNSVLSKDTVPSYDINGNLVKYVVILSKALLKDGYWFEKENSNSLWTGVYRQDLKDGLWTNYNTYGFIEKRISYRMQEVVQVTNENLMLNDTGSLSRLFTGRWYPFKSWSINFEKLVLTKSHSGNNTAFFDDEKEKIFTISYDEFISVIYTGKWNISSKKIQLLFINPKNNTQKEASTYSIDYFSKDYLVLTKISGEK